MVVKAPSPRSAIAAMMASNQKAFILEEVAQGEVKLAIQRLAILRVLLVNQENTTD